MTRIRAQHAVSLLVTALMVALAAGSAKSSGSGAAGSASASASPLGGDRKTVNEFVDKMGVLYTKIAALMQKLPPDSACDAAKMIAKAPPPKDDHGKLAIDVIYGPYLARFASQDAKQWTPYEGPWQWLTASVYGNLAKFPGSRQDWELYGAADGIKRTLLPHRYMLVAWPSDESKNRLPAYNDKDDTFVGGRFDGYALVADVIAGTIECQKHIHFENDSKVKYRSRGLFEQHPAEAVLNDFEDRAEAALESALPGGPIKLGTSMGSPF